MVTLHEEISLQLFTVQNPDIETFINEARAHFEISSGNFYMSKYDMMVRADEAPYNERRVLASDYKEIGLWLPTESKYIEQAAVILVWADDNYPIPKTMQVVYLAPNGHLVMGREVIDYVDLRNWNIEDIVAKYI